MFPSVKLENTSYAELLKLAESLGVEGGRQETENLIELILQAQKLKYIEASDNYSDKYEKPQQTNKVFLNDIAFPKAFTLDKSDEKSASEEEKHETPVRVTRTRSADNQDMKKPLCQSVTFVLSESPYPIVPSNQSGLADLPKTQDKKEAINAHSPRNIPFVSKVKVPNFSKIHERAFKRMEALDEYVGRKSSSKNPIKGDSSESPPQSHEKKVIKSPITATDMKFNFTGTRSPGFWAERVSPSELKVENSRKSPTISKNVKSSKSPSLPDLKSPGGGGGAPKIKRMTPETGKHPQLKNCEKPRIIKENVLPVSSPLTSLQKRMAYNPKAAMEKSVCSKPFGGVTKPAQGLELHKKFTSKAPQRKTSAEVMSSQTLFINGVGTNKHFELQMTNQGIIMYLKYKLQIHDTMNCNSLT